MNKEIMKCLDFTKEMAAVAAGNCPFCSEEIKVADFKDDLSVKEYKISGLCQKCQDEMFG